MAGRPRRRAAQQAAERARSGGRVPADPATGADAGPDTELERDPEGVARTIVLRRLTDQPRTRADLAGKLAERGVPDDVATRVLDRFTEVGLVDDAEYARSWARSRQRSRGLAGRVIAQELRRKGVDDELVRDAVAEEIDDESERRAAHALVQKKLRTMRGLEEQKQVQRLVGMLARKGYPAGVAWSVVREEVGAERPPLESL